MNRILCYGDSNTWGYDPITKDRFPDDVRWTGVLSKVLGHGYMVIEEGLGGRTTVWDDLTEYVDLFEGAEAKSRQFSGQFRRIAQETWCAFLDSSAVIVSSPLDGIHFEAAEHLKLGQAVAAKVREIIKGTI